MAPAFHAITPIRESRRTLAVTIERNGRRGEALLSAELRTYFEGVPGFAPPSDPLGGPMLVPGRRCITLTVAVCGHGLRIHAYGLRLTIQRHQTYEAAWAKA